MKIGRNELCPCGSGKKYKKCCLRKGKNAITAITENDLDIYEVMTTKKPHNEKAYEKRLKALK